jgi:hypothetical protein
MKPHSITRRLAGVIILIAVALLATACGGKHAAAGASASAAGASARAEVSSSAGQAAKTQAEAIADDCKPAGTAGFNALEPGVPGAAAARKTFESCEKIPKAKVFALGICLGKAYSHAPAKGASGSAAEIARQAYLAGAEGACVQAAKGRKSAPASVPTAAKAATPSASTK